MFIGEAPGADEDAQGEPFVGRAGQLLNKIIEAVQMKREEVYICNVLKCRPPNNRDPQPTEMETCTPYLAKQIELIRPKFIICLGRIAAQWLLKTNESLTVLRSKVHQYRGATLLVTYHPAALLRNPSWKVPTWEDMKLFKKLYDEYKATRL
jgi:DNA polymerase